MNGIFHHWLLSLTALHPLFFIHFLRRAISGFVRAVKQVLIYFPWTLTIDIVCVGFFGCKVIEVMKKIVAKESVMLPPLLMIGMLVIGVMTFLMQIFFVLFLRRDHFLLNPRVYIQTYVQKYVQFVFFTAFATAFIRLILFSYGLQIMPPCPELLLFLMKAFELLALFFWLDSNHSLKALFRSFEQAANLLIYTLPVILAIAALSFASLATLVGSSIGWNKILEVPYMISSFVDFFVNLNVDPSLWQILVIKYVRFVIDGITVALLYTWYRRKRSVKYTEKLFSGAPK